MQLTYRGSHYQVPASDVSTAIDGASVTAERPQINLFYRGAAFTFRPLVAKVSETEATDAPRLTLTYRGQTYTHKPRPAQSGSQPGAINWRWWPL